jgi:uncharacterized protein
MPANLTPDYQAAEQRYREATTPEEKLEALREMLAVIPKHKGTEKLQADLKQRLSRLQEEQEHRRRSGARHHDPGHVPKEGAGQIALLGPPNAGKSSLLAALTHGHPEIAEYPFTTHLPQPGMMPFEDAQVQLVDTPPFTMEPFDTVLVNVARGADGLALLLAPSDPEVLDQAAAALRLLTRCRIVPCGRPIPADLSLAARVLPVRLVLTKQDLSGSAEDCAAAAGLVGEALGSDLAWSAISTRTGAGLEDLRLAFYRMLGVIRVYAKEPGRKPDFDRPFVLKEGSTVLDLARVIHKDLEAHFRFARVWGSSRFEGQPVERDHRLADRDVVEIHA